MNKSDIMIVLGSVLVRVGHRDLAASASKLRDAALLVEGMAMQPGTGGRKVKPIEKVPTREVSDAAGPSALTALIVAAIAKIAKNDFQGAWRKITEAESMVRYLANLQAERRKERHADAV